MNKSIKSKIKSLLCTTLAFSVLSCNIQPSFNETSRLPAEQSLTSNAQVSTSASNIIPFVQVNMNVNPAATGTVVVQLHNEDGTQIMSSTRDVSSMLSKGRPTWYTFTFPISVIVARGTKLRLYIRRSDDHQPGTNNTIYLSTSSTDVYSGSSSLGNKDISFITYNSFSLPNRTDQRQTQVRETQALDNASYVWQQFETGESTGAAVMLMNYAELNLTFGPVPLTGILEVAIMNGNGTEVLAITSVPADALRRGVVWNSFNLFSSPLIVTLGQKHRIQVTRRFSSSTPDATDFISWASAAQSCSSTDYYRHGVSSRGCDFAFRTFGSIGTGLDQVQETATYLSPLVRDVPQWQEFVPGAAL